VRGALAFADRYQSLKERHEVVEHAGQRADPAAMRCRHWMRSGTGGGIRHRLSLKTDET
jgi:hypothetical protein